MKFLKFIDYKQVTKKVLHVNDYQKVYNLLAR